MKKLDPLNSQLGSGGTVLVLMAVALISACGTVKMDFAPPSMPTAVSPLSILADLYISDEFLDYKLRESYSTSWPWEYELSAGAELAKVVEYVAQSAFSQVRDSKNATNSPLYVEPAIVNFDPGYGGATALSTVEANISVAWKVVGPCGSILWSDTVSATVESRRGISRGAKQTSNRLRRALQEVATNSIHAITGSEDLQWASESPWLQISAAAARGDTVLLHSLLDDKVDPTLADRDGCTAAIAAARHGESASLSILLDRGADPNQADSGGHTPLMYAAARHGESASLSILLDRGADPNQADSGGHTLLMYAAANGHRAIISELLDRGGHPNIAGRDGGTALMAAANNGHIDSVRLLLEAGADRKGRSHTGAQAGILAWQEHHQDISILLTGKSADPTLIALLEANQVVDFLRRRLATEMTLGKIVQNFDSTVTLRLPVSTSVNESRTVSEPGRVSELSSGNPLGMAHDGIDYWEQLTVNGQPIFVRFVIEGDSVNSVLSFHELEEGPLPNTLSFHWVSVYSQEGSILEELGMHRVTSDLTQTFRLELMEPKFEPPVMFVFEERHAGDWSYRKYYRPPVVTTLGKVNSFSLRLTQ